MSDAPSAIPPFIAELTGPVLLGHLFNWSLFGALTVQTYMYYISFPKDRTLPKVLVTTVFTIEVLQTVLSTRDAFRNFGTGWGNMEDLNRVGWLWFSVPVLSSIISWTVQSFYAWRIYTLSHRIWIPGTIVIISLVQTGAGIYCGAVAHILGVFSEVQKRSNKSTSIWLGGTALCDVIIAISMLFYLSRARSGFRDTNLLLARIIRITIETGFICAAFAILDLAFFLRFPHNNYHLAPSIALSKLYSNSLLVLLNSRMRVVGGRDTQAPPPEDYHLSFVHTSTGSTMLPLPPHASGIDPTDTIRSRIGVAQQISSNGLRDNDKSLELSHHTCCDDEDGSISHKTSNV